tara:strand:- start:99357 stop:101180 length:1824 start_codon:yes stop_codon:yes gene_type:complete
MNDMNEIKGDGTDGRHSWQPETVQISWKVSRNGKPVPCINGKAQASLYDPLKEALRQIDALEKLIASEKGPTRLLIVGSCGPVFFEALLQAGFLKNLQWALVEPVSEIRKALLNPDQKPRDVAGSSNETSRLDSLKKQNDRVLTEDEANHFIDEPCLLFALRGAIQSHPLYERLYHRLNDRSQRRQINRNTLNRFGTLWMRNLYGNALAFPGAGRVNQLEGLYSGRSAIILGAGPSLSDHIEDIALLQRMDPSPVIIAVDTALSVCSLHNVVPDYVLTVDPQPINFYHLAGENYRSEEKQRMDPIDGEANDSRKSEKPGRPTLIADPSCSPLALRRWSGSLMFTGNPFPLAQSLFEFWGLPLPAQLSYGGSVSTNAYDLALFMGCSRLLLVGQDLSFTATRVHARGSALEELWGFREDRFRSRETGNYRQRFAIPVVPLPSESGESVHSNDKLQVFYQWFSSRLQQDQSRSEISILSSGGASFPGISLYPTATDWWKARSKKVENRNASNKTSWKANPERATAATDMTQFLDDLKSLDSLLKSGRFLEHWQELTKCIRVVGAPLQQEIEILSRSREVSPGFLDGLKRELRKHQILMNKLRHRADAEH